MALTPGARNAWIRVGFTGSESDAFNWGQSTFFPNILKTAILILGKNVL
jgi:hypothetical protein